jgi:hypothetical protein
LTRFFVKKRQKQPEKQHLEALRYLDRRVILNNYGGKNAKYGN